jgi:hypothetical protein
MGWQDLFADLEGEFDAAEAAELAAEVEDRSRLAAARLRLVDQLRPMVGAPVVVAVIQVGSVRGVVADVGPDWLLVDEEHNKQALVPLAAVLAVAGVGARSAEPETEGVVAARLRLGYALRAIARDRAPVAVSLIDGSRRTGTIDRVGADFITLAEHDVDEVRRPAALRDLSAVPFAALACVRST